MSEHRSPSVVDLFCGAGGLSHGFYQEGFRIAAGIDVDESCRHAYEKNNNAPFIRRDVKELSGRELDELYLDSRTRVLVGCAPCQAFSTYNQKNNDVDKWNLLRNFTRLVAETNPHIVSMENVPSLVRFKSGSVFNEFVESLEMKGYFVAHGVVRCTDFGLAQSRSRLVLLASRLGKISLPQPSHVGRARTVREEIFDLPLLNHGQCDPVDSLHRASRLSEINVARIEASKPGGTWRDWDEELVSKCHVSTSGKGYFAVYGRMDWDLPAPTITTQFYGFGSGRFGHPDQRRALSLREGAILQGFPRGYEFVAPGEPVQMKQLGRMIGNAVPVALARAIAKTISSHLEVIDVRS